MVFDVLLIIITGSTFLSLIPLLIITNNKEISIKKIGFVIGFLLGSSICFIRDWIELGVKSTQAKVGLWILLSYQIALILFIFAPKTLEKEKISIDNYFVVIFFFLYSYLPVGIIGMDYGWWDKKNEEKKWSLKMVYSQITAEPWNKLLFSQIFLFLITAIITYYVFLNTKEWIEKSALKNTIQIKNFVNPKVLESFEFFLAGIFTSIFVCIIMIILQLIF